MSGEAASGEAGKKGRGITVSAIKDEVIETFRRKESDTGSAEVQVALLTHRLENLNKHFADHKLDHHSRQGLLKIVSKRKRLLNYLKNEDITRYRTLIGQLGLRK